LLRYLKPYRLVVALVFGLVFLQSLANLYFPTLMASIVDTGIVKGDTACILHIGGIMLLTTVAGTACAIAASFFSARVALGFGRAVRGRLFAHVAAFSLHEFDAVSTASLITRTTNDTTQVQQIVLVMLSMMISAPLMFVAGVILAISQDATLPWVLVGVIPILVATILLIMRTAIPLFQTMQAKLDQLNLVVGEGLSGVRVIRAFDRTEHEDRRFAEANLDLTSTVVRVNRIVALVMPMMLVLNLSAVVILWVGSVRVNNGAMQVGALMAFLQYAMQILFALLMISMKIRTLSCSWSRKYSAMVSAVKATRERAPGDSLIWPNTRTERSNTPEACICKYSSFPSRVRSPTPAKTAIPWRSRMVRRIRSRMRTVFPTPAPPNSPSFGRAAAARAGRGL
jgi:ATP-binding cassette subfamily B protein